VTALAVVDNSVPLLAAFDGVGVDNTSILIKYTYYGDANLDGKVDAGDLARFNTGLASDGALTGWQNGDFNYDGVINGDDLMLLNLAASLQTGSIPSSVPEPAGMGLIAAAGALATTRRVRRNRTAR
jgi:hypothetical protein